MNNDGTSLYMAPEVSRGEYDERIDVYSFGLILYEIITGDGIFCNDRNISKFRTQLLTRKRPHIPEDVIPFTRNLIRKCWSSEASKRPRFSKIWNSLKENEFVVMNGVDIDDVKVCLSGIKAREKSMGIKID
jgi:serine/threonine protein kinase